MKSNFYQTSQENFETILKYYESTNSKIKKFYQQIQRYIKFTNEYCTKIKQLFKDDENNIFNVNSSSEESETIEIDYGITNKEIKNKILTKAAIIEKRINISPILNCIGKINKFFNEYTQYLQLFIDTLEIPLGKLNKYIEVTNSEIISVKNNHNTQKNNFIIKCCEFDSLNSELKKLFSKTEKKLMDYCIEIKNKKKKRQELEDKLNLSLSTAVQTEKDILEKFNSLDNFGKIFNDSTNEKINTIKDFTSSLFQKFNYFLINMFAFFKKSFLLPMEQIMNPQNENNVDDEIKIKKEFDQLLDGYIKKIDTKNIKSNLDIYNLKIIKTLDEKKLEEITEDGKIRKKNSFEIININNDFFEEEDSYFVIKNMYDKFMLINKNMNVLETEGKKVEIKKIINKLTSYGQLKRKKSFADNDDWNLMETQKIETKENNDEKIENENIKDQKDENNNSNTSNIKADNNNTNNIKDNNDNKFIIIKNEEKEIKKQDIDYLISLMNDTFYQRYFLLKINNYRTLGVFEMPLDIYKYIKEIFSAILNNLIFIKNEKDKNINDQIENAKLILILSQTFYINKDGEKIYIQKELKNEKIFQHYEFWQLIIKNAIDNEMKNLQTFINNNIENEKSFKEKKQSIAFAQLLPYVDSMIGFGVNEDTIKTIIAPFVDKYEMSEESKEIIFNLLKNTTLQ